MKESANLLSVSLCLPVCAGGIRGLNALCSSLLRLFHSAGCDDGAET